MLSIEISEKQYDGIYRYYKGDEIKTDISLYNSALERGADSEILEEALERVYNLIDPINTEGFENYSNAQANLRKHEIDIAKRIIQE